MRMVYDSNHIFVMDLQNNNHRNTEKKDGKGFTYGRKPPKLHPSTKLEKTCILRRQEY